MTNDSNTHNTLDALKESRPVVVCLMRVCYYEKTGKILKCEDCYFHGKCVEEVRV